MKGKQSLDAHKGNLDRVSLSINSTDRVIDLEHSWISERRALPSCL